LAEGADVLVATPGRLTDFIERDKVGLSAVRFLVIEQLDRLLAMGFELQLARLVEQCKCAERQTLISSLTDDQEVRVKSVSVLNEHVLMTNVAPKRKVTHDIRFVEGVEKQDQLWRVLEEGGLNVSTLIFVNFKRTADSLQSWLTQRGAMAVRCHGDCDQAERTAALASFQSGETPLLVATNIASRGTGFRGIRRILNFDCPDNIDDYVHRAGCGDAFTAVTFVTTEDAPFLSALRRLVEEDGQVVDWPPITNSAEQLL